MKRYVLFPFLLSLLLAVVLFPANLLAHGDEEHGAKPAAPAAADHFTAFGESDKYELTLYYPELSAGQDAHLTLYIANFNTNKPIDKAELTVSTLENPQATFEIEMLAPGVYELHSNFPENKIYTLNVQIAHPNGADLIGIKEVEVGKKLPTALAAAPTHTHTPWWWFAGGILLGGLIMWFVTRRRNRTLTAVLVITSAWLSTPGFNPVFAHGDDEHGPKSGATSYGKTVFAPKETQFLFEILTYPIAVGDYQSATTMFGTIVPASGGLGTVVAPQNGRITRLNVTVGQTVRAGQVLAVLQQTLGAADQVGIASSNAGLAVQVETARSRVTATRRELDRLNQIRDIAAAKDVQAAEAAYNQALTELQTLERRGGASASAGNRTVSLVAPISGVVAAFTLSPGAEVVGGQTLLTVTNLSKVYVEAQVYDRDVPTIQAGNKFLVTCSTDDHKTAEVRLIAQAQTINPGNQSQRVLFEMDNPRGEFKIGEFVTVKALNQQKTRQITVPNSALTEINGKPAVFIKDGPELFTLSYVQPGEDDGTRTLILKGVEEGEKVVSAGAYEVKMMYLNQ